MKSYQPIWRRIDDRVTVACDLCGRSDTTEIAKTDCFGSDLPTVICNNCGLVFTSPRLPPEAYSEFYRHDYRELYPAERATAHAYRGRIREELHLARLRFNRYQRFLGSTPRLLDVGAGLGCFLATVQSRLAEADVLAVEPDRNCAETIRTRWRIPVVEESFDGFMQQRPGHFSHVALLHVLEHTLKPSGVLAGVNAILAADGLVFVEVPNIDGPWTGVGMLHPAHLYHFTRATLTALMEAQGFEVLWAESFDDGPFALSIAAVGRKRDQGRALPPPCLQSTVIRTKQVFDARLANAAHEIRRRARRQRIERICGPRVVYVCRRALRRR